MKKCALAGAFFLLLFTYSARAQGDFVGAKAGVALVDGGNNSLGYTFELLYEKRLNDRFHMGMSFGVANQDDFPEFMGASQNFVSGVPPAADMYIRDLSLLEALDLFYMQNSFTFLQANFSYNFLRFIGLSVYAKPGFDLVYQQTSHFYLKSFEVLNGTVDNYDPAYGIETSYPPL